MQSLWLATYNRHKVDEFKHLLTGLSLEIHSASEIPAYTPPKETGKNFLENAKIKAKFLKAIRPDAWVVADDSGIEIEGLNHFPGVHSAVYAGDHASDVENYSKALKMLQLRSPTNRKARMVCVLVIYSPEGKEFIIEGVLNGKISEKPQGKDGFGYDPIFIPEENDKTLAELGAAIKNKISHRALASQKLKSLLQEFSK